MEGITRLVSESLARHGFDRPLDYRRLHWSRWFRCESIRSLLFVPSKPGVFALAEEVIEFQKSAESPASWRDGQGLWRDGRLARPAEQSEATLPTHVGTAALGCPAEHSSPRRMLAVTQFFEDDDMAFALGRMLSIHNPMRPRLASGRYFVRFVVIEEAQQRRSICGALNQWIADSGEKASGIGAHFATSLELTETNTHMAEDAHVASNAHMPSNADMAEDAHVPSNAHVAGNAHVATAASAVPTKRSEAEPSPTLSPTLHTAAPQPDSGAAANPHRPAPFPSGF